MRRQRCWGNEARMGGMHAHVRERASSAHMHMHMHVHIHKTTSGIVYACACSSNGEGTLTLSAICCMHAAHAAQACVQPCPAHMVPK